MTGNKCVMSSHLMLQTSSLTPCPVPRGGGRGGVSNSLPLPSLPPLLQSTSCNFSFQAILLRYLTPLAKGENSSCHLRSRAPALGRQLFSQATTQEIDAHIYSSPLMFVKRNILLDSLRVLGVLTYSLPSSHLGGLPGMAANVKRT